MPLTKRADGRYRVKYKGLYFYGSTEREAKQKRDDYLRQEKADRTGTTSITVAQYASSWLPTAKASVSNKCYNDYAKQIDKLISVIGDLTLSAVNPSDIKRVYAQYVGLSASTIKRSRMLYVSLFESALEDGLISRNPAKAKTAQPHQGEAGSHRCLEKWEIDLILNTPHRFQRAAVIMLYAGLRRGECLALTSADIDIKNKVINVNKAIRFESNQPILDTPKTAAGMRSVPIFSPLEPFLRDVNGIVCPSVKGLYMSEKAFNSQWNSFITAIQEKMNGCQKRWKRDKQWKQFTVRPHDLRHTFCTMLRDNGVDMKLAMKWLGHADEKMILRVYDHVTEDRIKSAIDAVNNAIGGQNGGQTASPSSQTVAV